MSIISELAKVLAAITQPVAQATRLRTARLDGFTTNPGRASITLAGGALTGIPYLASYTPVVGATVLVLQTASGQMLILGAAA